MRKSVSAETLEKNRNVYNVHMDKHFINFLCNGMRRRVDATAGIFLPQSSAPLPSYANYDNCVKPNRFFSYLSFFLLF